MREEYPVAVAVHDPVFRGPDHKRRVPLPVRDVPKHAGGVVRILDARHAAEHRHKRGARERAVRLELPCAHAVDPAGARRGLNGRLGPVMAAVIERRLDIDLAGGFLLKTIIGRDAARVRLRDGPELGIAREELLTLAVAADKAVLHDHGRDIVLHTVADDAVIVGELAVGIERVVLRTLFDQAAIINAEIFELHEDVRADTVEHFGNLGPVVAVTDEHLSAARRLAGRGIQMQAHEQIGVLTCCKEHAVFHLAQRRGGARAVAVRARHVHMDIAVRLELLL